MPNDFDTVSSSGDGLRDLVLLLSEHWFQFFIFVLTGLVAVFGLKVLFFANEQADIGLLSTKADYLREAHDNYNVLLIGTSRTYRGVDPIQLQEVANSEGCDVRAFNFGISDLRQTELRILRDRLSPDTLKDYDLILMSPLSVSKIEVANWSSQRIRHFNDVDGYWVSLVDIWQAPMTHALPKKLYYSALLTGSFAYHQLGIGLLAERISADAPARNTGPSGDLFDGDAFVDFSRHGFVALEDETSEQFIERGRVIREEPDVFETLKRQDAPVEAFRGAAAEGAWLRFQDAMDHLAGFDVPVAMFLPPMLPRRAQDLALAELAQKRGLSVLNYNQLDLHPELFQREEWFDYYHLGKQGAKRLTAMIGADICSLIE